MTSYFDTTYVRTKDLPLFFCQVFDIPAMTQQPLLPLRGARELPGLCLSDEQRARLRRAGIAYHSRVHHQGAYTLDIHVWLPGKTEESMGRICGGDIGRIGTPPDIAGVLLEFESYVNEA